MSADYEEISNHILGEWIASVDGEIVDNYLPVENPAWDAFHAGDKDMGELEEEDYSIRTCPLEGEAKWTKQ